jgi:hypothetical protein
LTQAENSKTEQSAISKHSQFDNFVSEGLRIGSHIVANKSHGKTRLMFNIAEELMKQPNVRNIIFDGSETWLYSFSKIAVFDISERDIIESKRRNVDTIEKYSLENWNLVLLALQTHKDLLFRLKTRKPSKRGFFIRTVINYLDQQQRAEKMTLATHENSKAIGYYIEEAQNAFSSRSTSSTETEEFLTVFNEGRNNKDGFFTSSQRLTDFSKTIRSKQIQCIGKLSNEDISPNLRRIEKTKGLDFANMKPKHWFYEGSIFVSPEFKQVGKPYIVNQEIKQLWLNTLPKPKTLSQKINDWFNNQRIKAQAQRDQRRISNQTLNDPLECEDDKSVYNESERMDEEIEDDGLIEDELGL